MDGKVCGLPRELQYQYERGKISCRRLEWEGGAVSSRVALLLRSAEAQPYLPRFVWCIQTFFFVVVDVRSTKIAASGQWTPRIFQQSRWGQKWAGSRLKSRVFCRLASQVSSLLETLKGSTLEAGPIFERLESQPFFFLFFSFFLQSVSFSFVVFLLLNVQ